MRNPPCQKRNIFPDLLNTQYYFPASTFCFQYTLLHVLIETLSEGVGYAIKNKVVNLQNIWIMRQRVSTMLSIYQHLEDSMRAVIQRVTKSSVTVDDEVVGQIGCGLTVLLGVEEADTEEDAKWMAQKIPELRIFNDDDGKFNRSLRDVNGAILLISQFTLHGDCRKGRRPSFIKAAQPDIAIPLYEKTISLFRDMNIPIEKGVFGAHMDVSIQNDGPVTLLLDSRKQF